MLSRTEVQLGLIALFGWVSINAYAEHRVLSVSGAVGLIANDQMIAANELPAQELATVDQIQLLQKQIDQLSAAALSVGVPDVTCIPCEPKKPEKTYPDFKISGVFQADTAYFSQDAVSQATLGDIQDGTGFRRARLAAVGNISERASYQMEFDFAQTQARLVDVWGQFKDTPVGNVRVGRFRQPFGMSELTSVRELPLLERPITFALAPFRQTGIMLFDTAYDEQMTWAVSGFRTISDNFGNVYGDNGGYGTAERITALLYDQGDRGLIHVGFDHSYLNPARDQIQYASQDEIFVGQQPSFGPAGFSVQPSEGVPPFVNSGVFAVDSINLFNIEGAVSFGRGLIESEFRWSNVDLPTGENVTVEGGYVTVRYVLTGEVIPYNRSAGVFGRVKPNHPLDVCKGDWGAWEIAGRVSNLNLNPLFGQPGVPGKGRELLSSSLALNWYMLANAKCQFEFVDGRLDDPTLGRSDTNTYAARVQFDF